MGVEEKEPIRFPQAPSIVRFRTHSEESVHNDYNNAPLREFNREKVKFAQPFCFFCHGSVFCSA